MTNKPIRPIEMVVALSLVALPACSSRSQLKLELQREVVVGAPSISGATFDPSGRVDTRGVGRTVAVTMNGDPGLKASFDVAGKFSDRPMQEVQPGVYRGLFEVQAGESGRPAVTTRLLHVPTGAVRNFPVTPEIELFQSSPPPVDSDVLEAAGGCGSSIASALDSELQARTVHFAFARADLSNEARIRLDGATQLLASRPGCVLRVDGHADEIGSPEYNMDLSRRRAESVIQFLVSQGVPAARLIPHAHGETEPIDPGRSAAARSRNRRVELHLDTP